MSRERPFDRTAPEKAAGEIAGGRRLNGLIIFAVALFALLSFYGVIAVISQSDDFFLPGNELKPGIFSSLPGVDSGENPAAADINQRLNILVLGLDRRLDEPKDLATRTDTVFIMTVDPFSKTSGILSIPRDLVVEIPNGSGGYYDDRVNVAYETGEVSGSRYPGGGPQLIKDTIEHNFGIPIDNYVVLDFANFIDIIDELSGIDINVPEDLYDPQYQDCNSCALGPIEFSAGQQHMDGRTALAYARIRYGSNDLRRIERQQLVMRATAEKATRVNFLSPGKVSSLYDKYKNAVRTDISDFRLPGLGALARQIPPGEIQMFSLNDVVYDCNHCLAAVLLADWDKVDDIVQQLFLDGVVRAEAAQIEIQNGTNIPGIATDVAERLSGKGFPSAWISLADNPASNITQTRIYSLNTKHYTAAKLAEWLGLPASSVIKNPATAPLSVNGPADIIIVTGTDVTLNSSGG